LAGKKIKMSNKKLWLIRVILIVGITAIIAIARRFSPTIAAAIGGITVGGAIAYLITIIGARWQKPLWWIDVAVALVLSLYLFFLAITKGSIGFWVWAVFMSSVAVAIAATHAVIAMWHKK